MRGGSNIVCKEVGRCKGSGTIEVDLTKYLSVGLIYIWATGMPEPSVMTYMSMEMFKSGTKFKAIEGSGNDGAYYAIATYVDDTHVKIDASNSNAGAVLYGIYIE